MPDIPETDVAAHAASIKRGSIVAAAGCGKTEQIALATKASPGRRLILTHTHAGVDVLRARLKSHNVPRSQYHIDTIAGWCLRYTASYPARSGLRSVEPRSNEEWQGVYHAAAKLFASGTVYRVIQASYAGVFVDEYQDCGAEQHTVIKTLSEILPTCIFGDYLQAIFDFKQQPLDWGKDVFPFFTKEAELTKPWRWHNAGNNDMAHWLRDIRGALKGGSGINLQGRPSCVTWQALPDDDAARRNAILAVCKSAIPSNGDRLVIMDDPANLNGRALLAQKLSKFGFSNIEAIGCQTLFQAAQKLDAATGQTRLEVLMEFMAECMTGTEQTEFLRSVKARQEGKRKGTAKFGSLIDIGVAIVEGAGPMAAIDLLDGFRQRSDTYIYRREMFYAMRSALHTLAANGQGSLSEAMWQVQNKTRHAGRIIGRRSIGSTLLVKGLEFEHAVVIHTPGLTREDWYVALTRATKTLTIISPTEVLSFNE